MGTQRSHSASTISWATASPFAKGSGSTSFGGDDSEAIRLTSGDLIRCLHEPGTVLLETVLPADERRGVLLFAKPHEVRVATNTRELNDLLDFVQAAGDGLCYAAGYLNYEAGFAFEPRAGAIPGEGSPLAWFGVYDRPVEVPSDILSTFAEGEEWRVRDVKVEWPSSIYCRAFERVRRHIFEGDVYQINLTTKLRFDFSGSPVGLYGALIGEQRDAFGAFVNTGRRQILCRSPELFFARSGRRILARPMKGTRAVGDSSIATMQIAESLAHDQKNRAENLMIVDLLRNDLSVVCEPASVSVRDLFSTEVHETVIQMTSTICGTLRPEVGIPQIIPALFPCGSVTGAPKIRAMQVIQELETSPRDVYCGAIGYVGPHDSAVFNVAIRTVELEECKGSLGTGSGIVWDSNAEEEYAESLLKARFFTEAVENAERA